MLRPFGWGFKVTSNLVSRVTLFCLVVGRETLVAAGHVTTQILAGKEICWAEGVVEYFVCSYDKRFFDLWVSNPRAVAKICPLRWILPMKNATLYLQSPKYGKLSFTKKFGSWMEHKPIDGLTNVERRAPNRGVVEFGGNIFSPFCGILDVKKYFCHTD